LWRGGGVIFGPKPRDFEIKMNRKERRLALRTAFQDRLQDAVVVEDFNDRLPRPKTKEVYAALQRWGIDPDRCRVLAIAPKPDPNVTLSMRNLPGVKLIYVNNLNVYDLLTADRLVVTSTALNQIQEVYGDD
jgi:large subunit ribosomal protein L4